MQNVLQSYVIIKFLQNFLAVSEKSTTFVIPKRENGVLAQLVERLNGIQKVRSSILLCSTKDNKLIIKHLQPSKPFELGGFFRKRHRFLRPLEAKCFQNVFK